MFTSDFYEITNIPLFVEGEINMGKDSFDLDIQVKENGGQAEPNITSVYACTPGTCWKTCKGKATLNSNCCIGTFLCSLGGGC